MSAQQPVPAPAGKWKPQVSPPPPPKDGQKWPALRVELQDANARIAALESELAAVRQIVADVETCRGSSYRAAITLVNLEPDPANICVTVCVRRPPRDDEYFHAETWQTALHAAAEWVRAGGTNDRRCV